MSGSVRVFIASSLDGFIAGPDDDLSWLGGADAPGEDYGYAAFMAGTDAILMGRRTYDVVQAFDAWPYGDTPVFVATSRPLEAREPTVTAVTGAPGELLAAVRERGAADVYLDGGALIRSFLDAGLVDELTVTVVPVVLGAGSPLFAGAAGHHRLELRRTATYPTGLVQLVYRPVTDPVDR